MQHRHRYMFYLTGSPGWIRFGFSPGWQGLLPTPYYLMNKQLPQSINYTKNPMPSIMPSMAIPKEQEIAMLEEQINRIQERIKQLKEE